MTPQTSRDPLDQAFDAARRLDCETKKLVATLDQVAAGELPVGLEHLASLPTADQAASAAIVLLSEPALWNRVTASSLIREAGAALTGIADAGQMRRRAIDHSIALGVGGDATVGTLVDVRATRALINKRSRLIVLYHIKSAILSANNAYLHPLEAAIRRGWGVELSESADHFTISLFERFVKPGNCTYELYGGRDSLVFFSSVEGVSISGIETFKPVLPGCRRILELVDGKAWLRGPRDFEAEIKAGTFLVIRALDEMESEIQVMNGKNDGRKCTLKAFEWARLEADPDEWAPFYERSCTCGTVECEKRHCIVGWKEMLRIPEATLESFIFTAIKGVPAAQVAPGPDNRATRAPNAFQASMYFSALLEGERLSV
jgi:hypothetical protein